MKFWNWEKYKVWISTGAILIPTACYFTYKMYKARELTKSGQFEKKINFLKNLITKKQAKAENIHPLKKVKTSKMKDMGSDLEFEVHWVENMFKKQNLTKSRSSNFKKDDPFLPPFEKGMYITDLGNHRILFNKFPLIKNHVLVVTKSFEDQHTALSAPDFESTYLTLRALNGLAFYNSGPESGASQPHRHFQVMPMTREVKTDVINDINLLARADEDDEDDFFIYKEFLEIKHLVMRLRSFDPENEEIKEYSEYLFKVYKKILGHLDNSELEKSYNILMTKSWIMVAIRDKGKAFGRFSINAAGLTGSLLVKSAQDLQDLSNKSPIEVLREICQPHEIVDVD